MTTRTKKKRKKKKEVLWAFSAKHSVVSRKLLKAHSISNNKREKNNREHPQDQEANSLEGVHLS
jgi:hypothetical protein